MSSSVRSTSGSADVRADLPAIREAEASGATAEIFADLRATLGVPFVNLIWRHLATIPTMLAWSWASAKPLYTSTQLWSAARELRGMVQSPTHAAIPRFVFESCGLTPEQLLTIIRLVDSYNRANSANLLTLLVLRALLTGSPPGNLELSSLQKPESEEQATLPILPVFSDLSEPHQLLIRSLDQFGRRAPSNAIASLYTHLAYWPAYLSIMHTALGPSHESGALQSEQVRILEHAKTAAEQLLLRLPRVNLPDERSGTAAARAIEIFTELMIARMLVIGRVMIGLMPQGEVAVELPA
jgi:hypothetical protein